jgi:hypothetical protein
MRDFTPQLMFTVVLGFAIWATWFYAVYKFFAVKQPPRKNLFIWLAALGVALLVGSVVVIRWF